MKKIVILVLITISLVFTACQSSALYDKTDYYVNELTTTVESYGIFGGTPSIVSNEYQIYPMGRLINVKLLKSNDYESLLKDLKRHYKNDNRVNDVYKCNAGTIMIDCRN